MPEHSPARWPAMMGKKTLAEYTGLSERTLDKLQATGTLPAPVPIPGVARTLFRREAVDAWIADLAMENEERQTEAAGS